VGVRAAPAFEALDLRSSACEKLRRDKAHKQTLHSQRKSPQARLIPLERARLP